MFLAHAFTLPTLQALYLRKTASEVKRVCVHLMSLLLVVYFRYSHIYAGVALHTLPLT